MKQKNPADELAIRNLVARMAQTADRGAVEDYAPMMAADARWVMPNGEVTVGPEEMMAGVRARRAGGSAGPGSNTRHMVNTTTVEVDGDAAQSLSYWLYISTGEDPKILLSGTYADTFRRIDGTWVFAERQSSLE